jgi:phosphatidylglycerophosphate synthase
MNQKPKSSFDDVLLAISQGRDRTNLLKKQEQKTIAFLVQYIPSWVSSNMLTGVGFFGNVVIFVSFILGKTIDEKFLLMGIAGFAISWFGDSLDGRIAYYRNKPRKWYGFSLDLVVDWIGIVLVGLGFIVYAPQGLSKILGYAFIVLYGLEIIIALLRYKISGEYSIDAGKLSPTEARIGISLFLVLEVIFHGTLIYMAGLADLILAVSNFLEFKKLARIADRRDEEENKKNISKMPDIKAK